MLSLHLANSDGVKIDSLASAKSAKDINVVIEENGYIYSYSLNQSDSKYAIKAFVSIKYGKIYEFEKFLSNIDNLKIHPFLFFYLRNNSIPVDENILDIDILRTIMEGEFYVEQHSTSYWATSKRFNVSIEALVGYIMDRKFSEVFKRKIVSLITEYINPEYKVTNYFNFIIASFNINDLHLIEEACKLYIKNKLGLGTMVVLLATSLDMCHIRDYFYNIIVPSLDFEKKCELMLSLVSVQVYNCSQIKLKNIYELRKKMFLDDEFEKLILKYISSDITQNERVYTLINDMCTKGDVNKVLVTLDDSIKRLIKNFYLRSKENIPKLNEYIAKTIISKDDILCCRNVLVKLTFYCNIFEDERLLEIYDKVIFNDIKLKGIFKKLEQTLPVYLLQMDSLKRYKTIKKYNLYWITNEELLEDIVNPYEYIKKYILLGKDLFKSCYTERYLSIIKTMTEKYNMDKTKIMNFAILRNISISKTVGISSGNNLEENFNFFNS